MLGLELLGLLYALAGYAVLVYTGCRTFAHLCRRWGVMWDDALAPYALRAAVQATLPLIAVSLMIAFRVFEPAGAVAQAGLVLSLMAFIGLLVYQAWVFAQSAAEVSEGELEDR